MVMVSSSLSAVLSLGASCPSMPSLYSSQGQGGEGPTLTSPLGSRQEPDPPIPLRDSFTLVRQSLGCSR